ncbi:MAG TPA: hypothetical protein VH814_05905 [Steroidobacteraceae bacterium]|jgi:hypothetical protein
MHHLITLFAGCLLYPPADDPCKEARAAQYEFLRRVNAAEVQWAANGSVSLLMAPKGIALKTGIEGFKVGQPAPELLEKVGPAMLATGREELRVINVTRASEMPERMPNRRTIVRLGEYIRDREVSLSSVNIALDEQTNEVTMLVVGFFLPDRGLSHEPRLTAAQARAKLEAELRAIPYQEMNPTFEDTPARLAYSFEQWGSDGGAGIGGALVWVFAAQFPPAGDEVQIGNLMVDATTGKITPRDNLMRYWNR